LRLLRWKNLLALVKVAAKGNADVTATAHAFLRGDLSVSGFDPNFLFQIIRTKMKRRNSCKNFVKSWTYKSTKSIFDGLLYKDFSATICQLKRQRGRPAKAKKSQNGSSSEEETASKEKTTNMNKLIRINRLI